MAMSAEYIDSTLGMGYGTTLTPILLLLGYEPLQVVPAILLSELITGLTAGFTHHSVGNVDFKPKTRSLSYIFQKMKELGWGECFVRGVPLHLRVTLLISSCSVFGTVAAVYAALRMPKKYLNIYIGVLVLLIGLFILIMRNRNVGFSWKKIIGLGMLAAFNKGMSGGGYGPVVTGGQILSGIDGKNAVGITSLAEGITCAVGVAAYFSTKGELDWRLAPYLCVGALFSVIPSALTVKYISGKNLKCYVGIITVLLGTATLYKVFR